VFQDLGLMTSKYRLQLQLLLPPLLSYPVEHVQRNSFNHRIDEDWLYPLLHMSGHLHLIGPTHKPPPELRSHLRQSPHHNRLKKLYQILSRHQLIILR
jgi:hypothetical protein